MTKTDNKTFIFSVKYVKKYLDIDGRGAVFTLFHTGIDRWFLTRQCKASNRTIRRCKFQTAYVLCNSLCCIKIIIILLVTILL